MGGLGKGMEDFWDMNDGASSSSFGREALEGWNVGEWVEVVEVATGDIVESASFLEGGDLSSQ